MGKVGNRCPINYPPGVFYIIFYVNLAQLGIMCITIVLSISYRLIPSVTHFRSPTRLSFAAIDRAVRHRRDPSVLHGADTADSARTVWGAD